MIELGADVEARDGSDLTPLMVAVRAHRGQRPELVKLLLRSGADPNAMRSSDGVTALGWAVAEPDPEVVRALLDGGADPNLADEHGYGPLFRAVFGGRGEHVAALLAAGARDRAISHRFPDPSRRGRTALELARQRGLAHAVDLLSGRCEAKKQPVSSRPPRPRLSRLLVKLERALLVERPDTARALRPPATREAFVLAEDAFGRSLPPPLLSLYRWHDGTRGFQPFHGAYSFMPLASAAHAIRVLRDLKRAGDLPSESWWRDGWFPFLESARGDYLCLDLDGGLSGKRGGVIEFLHDAGERAVLHESVLAWCHTCVETVALGEHEDDAFVRTSERLNPGYPIQRWA